MSATAEEILQKRVRGRSDVLFLHVRVSDHCNHACEHCYQVQGQKGELDTPGVLAMIDRAVDAGMLFLTISGGEATLRPDLFDIIAHARSRNVAVALFTNGFTMTEAMADRLAALALWHVQISLYSMDPAVHEAITRVPGSHARTVHAIEMLRERAVAVVISTPAMARNVAGFDDVQAFANRLGCTLKSSDELRVGEDGSDRSALRVSGEAQERRLENMRPLDFSTASIEERRRGATCGVARGSLAVEPNGEVRPCTQLHVPLGNVLRSSLDEISASEEAVFLRSVGIRHLHGCRDCDLIVACSRCHGSAASEAGDAFGPYLTACQQAVAHFRAMQSGPTTISPLPETPDRPFELGPFRIDVPGHLRQIPDVRTPEDDAIAARFPWVRPHAGYDREVLGAPRGELVQLRVQPKRRTG